MASSIKFLQFVQKFHQTVGIYPSQPNQIQHSTNYTKSIFLICYGQIMFTTFAFLVFDAKSMFDYGFAIFVLISIINSAIIYLIFIWQSQNTLKFIKNCEGFIEKRNHSINAYKEIIEKIELFNKGFCFALCATIVILFFTVLPYSYVRYYTFNMGAKSFHLFLPFWYPFYWKTPVGYAVAWLAQCIGSPPFGNVYIQLPNLGFGSCWLFIFMAKDITQDVAVFNIMTKTISDKNRAELMKRFCDMVQIYWDAKERVKEFNEINKYSLFAFFLWNMLGAACALVTIQFQLWVDDSNVFEVIPLFLLLFWVIIYIFLLCEPGTMMTNQFIIFGEELSRCDWYLLPMEMQQMYMIFLSDTQNPMKMLSYANITCERETSKTMINKATSYFLTIRRFRI